MIQKNNVELVGYVGSVRTNEYNGKKVISLSVACDTVYKDKDGNVVINTDWVPVTAWSGRFVTNKPIEKGAAVHVRGRIRNVRYTDRDGIERSSFEVLASSLSIILKDEAPDDESTDALDDLPAGNAE